MSQKAYIALGLIVTLLLFLYQVLKKDPLEKFLDRAIQAVQAKDTDAFMALISDEYIDRSGLTKPNIAEMLRRLCTQFSDIKIITQHVETTINSNTIGTLSLEFKVVATFVPDQHVQQGIDLSAYHNQRYFLVGGPTTFGTMQLALRQEGTSWKLTSVDHIDIGQPIPHFAGPDQSNE
ncbi:hypothetical protein JXQ70_00570 [bacterium]|nr:hypothetical protein [bacterium]